MLACKKPLQIWHNCPPTFSPNKKNALDPAQRGGGLYYEVGVELMQAELVFLDEGQGASGGVSYFANFLINFDQ